MPDVGKGLFCFQEHSAFLCTWSNVEACRRNNISTHHENQMTFPDQKIVAKRLHTETRRTMRQMENAGLRVIRASWDETKVHLKGAIAAAIVQDFGAGRWNAGQARRRGTFIKIERSVKSLIDVFVKRNEQHMVPFLREARFAEMTRTLWMMSQMVPPSVKINIPLGFRHKAHAVREAAVDIGIAGNVQTITDPSYTERLNAWLQAYKDNLTHNLNLGAINGGTLEDAIAEVEATKIGSPSVGVWDAIERLFSTEFIKQTQGTGGGHDDAMDVNDDAPFSEVWNAYSDGKVCDECAAQDGKTRDEVDAMMGGSDFDIPLHPNCRCWWSVEPKPWAELAGEDRTSGFTPTAMILRGEDGRIGGVGIITYGDWIAPNMNTLTQARRVAGLQP